MKKIMVMITVAIMSFAVINAAEISYATNYDMIAQFLGIEIGARASGMGNARVALSEGAEAVFINPANGKTKYYYNSLLISHNSWIGGTYQETIAFVKNTNSQYGIFGFGFSYLNEGTIEKYEATGTNGTYIGDITPYALIAKLNWSGQVIKDFYLGLNIGYMRNDIDSYYIQKGIIDIGVTYTGFKDTSIALVKKNFGR
ncbi:MAG TPA: hypothetical protein PLF61_00140, partial [Candidatus Goldiibacteriota bacterium]|nr:hypothetical protein [Candidatus Goldiibacteriota bacterium]